MGSGTVSEVHEPSGLDRDKYEKGVWNYVLDNDSFGQKYGTALSNRQIDGLPGFQRTWKCQSHHWVARAASLSLSLSLYTLVAETETGAFGEDGPPEQIGPAVWASWPVKSGPAQ